jgi:hypothetical protein
MTITRKNAMDLEKPTPAYPTSRFPLIVNHHTTNIKSFHIDNISHYVHLIMFGAYDTPTKDIITSLASSTSFVQSQANDREQLTSKNLFDNDFVVVSISRAVEKMASSFTSFLHATLRGQHEVQSIGVDDKPLYATMAKFLFTGELLQCANLVGINPDEPIRPNYIGFHEDDIGNMVTS